MRRQRVDIISSLFVFSVLCFLAALNVRPAHSQSQSAWSQEFVTPGINGDVLHLASSPDKNRIYVAGRFSAISDILAKGIAFREDEQWHTLPAIPNGGGNSIEGLQTDSDGNVYLIDSFDLPAGYTKSIIRWDGSEWRILGGTFENSNASFSVVSKDEIYAGYCDTNSAGSFGQGVSRWYEGAWQAVGSQECVISLHKHLDGTVFSVGNGGGFSSSFVEIIENGRVVQQIERQVRKMASGPNNELYASYWDPEQSRNVIGLWNGSDWDPLPEIEGQLNPAQMRVDVAGNLLIVNYTDPGEAPSFIQWDGLQWETLFNVGPVLNLIGRVNDFLHAENGLFIAGAFTSTVDTSLRNLALLKDQHLTSLASGGGLIGGVSAIEVMGSNIFIGGSFSQAGGIRVNSVVRREGKNWHQMGEGLLGWVNDLEAAENGMVYAGGTFRLSESEPMRAISKWDGSTWSTLGNGLQANGFPEGVLRVNAIEGDQEGNLYVGGEFDEAGGQPSPRIARWVNESWEPMMLPYPITSTVSVQSLKICHGNDLYVGLIKRDAKGQVVPFLKWDGSVWSVIGEVRRPSGDYTTISAIECTDEGVYIGGVFDEVSGIDTRNVAHWNGQSWLPLKGGVNAGVNALALNAEGNLVVAGSFRWADQTSAVKLAIWNGSDWEPFGKGTEMDTDEGNTIIATLTSVSKDSMFIGGRFQQIDDFTSSGIALYDFTKEDLAIPDPVPPSDPDNPETAVVYPNPISGESGHLQFFVEKEVFVSIYLYDSLGQRLDLLFRGNVLPDVTTEIEFSVSGLAAGTYYIRLQGQDVRTTVPFVVTR